MRKRKKIKKVKRRIPIPPPEQPHKSEKDYDREREKERTRQIIKDLKGIPAGKPGDFVHVPFVCHMYIPRITAKFVVTGTIVGPDYYEGIFKK